MHRAVAIANEFLKRAGSGGLTQMQLQKLVYFAHGWALALRDAPLVAEDVEAWNYGPVYRDLYDHTKYFGKDPIERLITPDDDEAARFFSRSKDPKAPYEAELTDYERQLIDAVWMRYGKLSGARLSALTHQRNTPWFDTFKSGRSEAIDNERIKQHYTELAAKARVRLADAASAA
ncbi:Panacea domain-containing protein [Allosphingosinicella vermicomposti]|uniref:Panacea domain-containing protein n=1 Tax=Allosphingosinicella vermicomposti TaxID=614671 RepID=UPI000D0F402E|nr:type II toxin-antitoxin system antitoxin SocA domain-containing protein [Allosphingosinicella vermicomposti]